MRIGLVGGGSGGHFYPLIAVAEEINDLRPTPELYYFGPSPYNKEDLASLNIKYIYCPAGKTRRYFSIQNFTDLFRNFAGLFVAIWKLYVIYPDVIFSKGSFTSVPIILAARLLRIPVVIHESDAVPGRANKLAASFAVYIAVSYDDAAQFFPPEKTALTGIPMRRSIQAIDPDPFTKLGISKNKPLIYVTGGSLGSERINNITVRSLPTLLPDYQIFHQSGNTQMEELRLTAQALLGDSPLKSDYYLEGSVPAETINLLLQAASVVITRAGSTTLFEIALHGKPAIIIPIAESVSHDQHKNAYSFGRAGAASVIEERNLTPHLLAQEIHSIINDPGRYQKMSTAAQSQSIPGAAKKIADILTKIASEHE